MPRMSHPTSDRTPDDIAIVTLSPDRWEEYRDLRLAALRAEPTAFGEPYDRAALHTPELWRSRLSGEDNWLVFAEQAGRLVGLAGAFLPPDAPGVALVVSVYVDASVRGRGVGRRMLSSLIERVAAFSEAVTLRLWVNDTNAPAIALYASLGFTVVGVERDGIQHEGRSYDELIRARPLRLEQH